MMMIIMTMLFIIRPQYHLYHLNWIIITINHTSIHENQSSIPISYILRTQMEVMIFIRLHHHHQHHHHLPRSRKTRIIICSLHQKTMGKIKITRSETGFKIRVGNHMINKIIFRQSEYYCTLNINKCKIGGGFSINWLGRLKIRF